MLRYFHWSREYPFLRAIGEAYYHLTLVAVVVALMVLAGRRLLALNYPERRVKLFVLLAIAVFIPAGYLSSRLGNIFYQPYDRWGVGLFLDGLLFGETYSFSTSILLPLAFAALIGRLTRLRLLETFDAITLYLPLANAFISMACLLNACGWGQVCRVDIYGWHFHFQNPVPLYSVAAHTGLFLFLRRLYSRLYSDPWARERYRGVSTAIYFLVYAAIEIILEVFRTEPRIFFGLTLAQVALGIYLLFSMASCFRILHRRGPGVSLESFATNGPVTSSSRKAIESLLSPALFLVFYLLAIFLFYHLTRTLRIWQWPFLRVTSLADAYLRIFYYLPVVAMPVIALIGLKRSKLAIRPYFKWERYSWTFLLGLAISLYFVVDLLVIRQPPRIRGIEIWPPILILSLMNAVSEEIMYRLALYRLIRRAQCPRWVAYMLQSCVYALIHYMIVGAPLGTIALIYGLVMQLVVNRNQSLIPAFICHFIIDMGCIGRPLLRI
jgi:membrane protease YdiL (CAAX protease family)/prolipoprotein diacylglyceryltransferase